MSIPRSRSRRLRATATGLALVALAACGNARPTSTLVGTAAPGGTSTTTSARPTTPATAAAPSTTTGAAAPTTAAATDPAAAGTTAAPAGPTTAAAPAATAPAPTTAAPAGAPLDPTRVGALFTRFGYAVTAEESACLAREITPEALATLEQGGDAALVGAVTSAFVMALARCEPLSFLLEQDAITVDDYGVTPEQARCVTKALDAAARNDAAMALAYYEGTATLPPEGQQRLIDAFTPCVGAAKAREIVTT